MRKPVPLALSVLAVASYGCATIAVALAPEKTAKPDDSAEARAADAAFWTALHGGHYEDIDRVLEQLQAAYLKHPEDPHTTAHIAFLHVWRLGESARLDHVPATITDDIALGRRYFSEAVHLAPDDPRIRGFLASMELAEGSIHKDEKLTRTGFYDMKDAVNAWPEFNLFTRGYVMSRLPWDTELYAAGVRDQWDNLDVCANGEKVDRKTADFSRFMALDTKTGWKRACFNSWIAPHNLEGFFLNMGDMVVKSGDPETARHIYAQARLSKEFPSWKFKDVLERRIAQANENVAVFRDPHNTDKERRIMFDSAFSCMACHQN